MSSSINTGSDATAAEATKHLLTRMAITSLMSMGYSTFGLGNGFSNAVVRNGLGLGASAAASEAIFRYAVPTLTHAKASGINSLGYQAGEAALAGAIYSQAYGRFIFPGSTVPMRELLMTGAGLDLASQIVSPRISAMLQGQQTY